jgi:hypothetical protein
MNFAISSFSETQISHLQDVKNDILDLKWPRSKVKSNLKVLKTLNSMQEKDLGKFWVTPPAFDDFGCHLKTQYQA